ncbi:MAG TPA: cyclic nucleotide-binding domain-containing protein [Alphaproteobacteria bacterium]|nr:cyclic nucleotide-binding domain-containing protein [Alphaproteobacteria bacterium]
MFDLERHHYAAGSRIFSEGDAGDTLYFVDDGTVAIWCGAEDAKVVLGQIGRGGLFGEMAVIDAGTRMASATALTDCTLMAIPGAALRERLAKSDPLVVRLLHLMVHDVRRMAIQMASLRQGFEPGAEPASPVSLDDGALDLTRRPG